eukprot:Colp12_sorted_trinity150504_noHs@15907
MSMLWLLNAASNVVSATFGANSTNPKSAKAALDTPLSPDPNSTISNYNAVDISPKQESEYPAVEGGASLILAWRLKGKNVLIVGGGKVAAGRVVNVLEADAIVTVVTPAEGLIEELQVRIKRGEVKWINRLFKTEDLDDKDMVLSAIDDPIISREIGELCRARNIPVNVADVPPYCDFWFMSTHRDRCLQVAVSSNGNGPKLANIIRRHIADNLPKNCGRAIDRVGVLRQAVRKIDPSSLSVSRRMTWLSRFCESMPIERIAELTDDEIQTLLVKYKEDMNNPEPDFSKKLTKGRLQLVGAGPGNPELLTVAALNAIKKADLVVTDRLIPQAVLDHVTGEIRVARKVPGKADEAQNELNNWVLEGLEKGQHVVRLKIGDPFLFGRGGEEILFFREHGYEAEVVPGISSCLAAGLSVHIPVTHRGTADQVLVLTGRGQRGTMPDLPPFVNTRTLVFLMAVERLPKICDTLISMGYPAELPAAVIEKATCPDQRTVQGTVANIAALVEAENIQPPATVIIGNSVVTLRGGDAYTVKKE